MKKTYIGAAIAAVVFGIFLVLTVRLGKSTGGGGSAFSAGNSVSVIVAKRDLPPHTKITQEDIEIVQVPEAQKHEKAQVNIANVVGQYNSSQIYKDEQILSERLSSSAEGGSGLSEILEPDMVAMSVSVDETSGVAGFIEEGDLVTIMDAKSEDVLEENVKVLKVGNATYKGGELPGSLTLELSPEAAQIIFKKSQTGKIQFILQKKDN